MINMENSTIELPQQEKEVPISRHNIFNYEPDSVETAQLPLISVGNPLEDLVIASQGHKLGSTRVLVEIDNNISVFMPAGLEVEDVEKLYNLILKGVYCEYLSEDQGNPEFEYLSIRDCIDLIIEQEQGSSIQIAPYAKVYIPKGLETEEIKDLSILLHRGVEVSKKQEKGE